MSLKKLKSKLQSEYKYRIELHAHTSPMSGCSEISPIEMVDTYKKLGYDAVVITNHFIFKHDHRPKEQYIEDFIKNFEETKEYGEKEGLKVYLGAEIRFTENNNDYLVFGVNKEMLYEIYDLLPKGLKNFRKSYPMPNSIFIQAHPMRDGMQPVDTSLLDGIEVYNMHPGHNSRVGQVAVYAKENGKEIITAGSDFHHKNKKHEGVAAVRTATLPEDSFSLTKILREKNYLLEIGRNNIIL